MTRSYRIYPDTNAFASKSPEIDPISPGFKAAWQTLQSAASVKLVVCEVVNEEALRHCYEAIGAHYAKSLKNQTVINSLYKTSLELPKLGPSEIKKIAEEKLRSDLSKVGAILSKTPSTIMATNLDEMINSAVWRVPPFGKNGKDGQGFRDAVVLETIKHDMKYNPGVECILITDDRDLQAAADILARTANNFSWAANLSEATAIIAASENFALEFLDDVKEKAHSLIESSEPPQAFIQMWADAVETSEAKNYFRPVTGLGFTGLLSTTSKKVTGNPEFMVDYTRFVGLTGKNTFHWVSKGIIVQRLESRETIVSGKEEDTPECRVTGVLFWWCCNVALETLEFSDFKLELPIIDRPDDFERNVLDQERERFFTIPEVDRIIDERTNGRGLLPL